MFLPIQPGADARIAAQLQSFDLARYVGGQAENHAHGGIAHGGRVFRGEIEAIRMEDDVLVMRFAWLGEMAIPGVWKKNEDIDFRLTTALITALEQDARGRIVIQAPFVSQMIILFPPGYTVDGEPNSLPRSAVPGA